MMKLILRAAAGGLLALMLAFGATAQQAEIEDTISSQIEAFKADDFETAFTYATPRLRQMFQSPQNFERMVTNGYPMVWRPAEVEYLEFLEQGGEIWQKVQILDQRGARHVLLYRMQNTAEGWRIGGVQILDLPGATA